MALKLVEVLGHVDHDGFNSMDKRVERGSLCKVRGPNGFKKKKKNGYIHELLAHPMSRCEIF
jgi:hypothetical protein